METPAIFSLLVEILMEALDTELVTFKYYFIMGLTTFKFMFPAAFYASTSFK